VFNLIAFSVNEKKEFWLFVKVKKNERKIMKIVG